ncbi:MAG: SusD/RagB family nutrient-binding outer membrane lipoprotein [Saprospiraceae bacterium]
MKNLKIYFWIFALIGFTSCEDYLDINTDPNKTADASLNTLLPTILYYTGNNTYNHAIISSQYCQQIGAVVAAGIDSQPESKFTTLWSDFYLNILPNANVMITKANESKSPHYGGIAKVIIAYNLGLCSSVWENIAYTSADNQLTDLSPSYDSQESVYKSINDLLDGAIADLSETESAFKPSTDDIIFKGVIANWLKTAYTLKARYLLHTAKKNGGSYDAVLDALSNGIKSNGEDFQLVYTDKNFNPWHSIALANNTGNLTTTFSRTFINMMNGTVQNIVDPRLPLLAYKAAAADPYKGTNPGAGSGSNVTYNNKTLFYGYHFGLTAPLQMITNAEARFIESEVLFHKNGSIGSDMALTAYLDGIKASMSKIGVADADITAFTDDINIKPALGELNLKHIMSEKYKALFLNPEVWNDLRRYDYSSEIYSGLELPENHNTDLLGAWVQRGFYPDSEASRNSEEASKNFKELNIKMWIFN